MTWYADEILTVGTPAAIRAIREDVLLAPFAYHVTEPLDHDWHVQDVVHGLPQDGLVVVRPVCSTVADDSAVDWYGEPVLDWYGEPVLGWTRFAGETDSELLALRARASEVCAGPELAPVALLAHLRKLARTTQLPFLFYSCSMWGGDVETEYAFVFDQLRQLALITLQPETADGPQPVMMLESSLSSRVELGDTLTLALRHLSLDLPTPYFAPHTRRFPWSKYKL